MIERELHGQETEDVNESEETTLEKPPVGSKDFLIVEDRQHFVFGCKSVFI